MLIPCEKGIQETQVQFVRIKMVRENQEQYSKYGQKLLSAADVTMIARDYFKDSDREEVVVFCLDTKNKITAINQVSVGSLNQSIIHPREVFKAAILSNSNGIIMVHNHPSGDPDPSVEDDAITKKIYHASQLLGIPLLDHVIITDEKHFSYADSGWRGIDKQNF